MTSVEPTTREVTELIENLECLGLLDTLRGDEAQWAMDHILKVRRRLSRLTICSLIVKLADDSGVEANLRKKYFIAIRRISKNAELLPSALMVRGIHSLVAASLFAHSLAAVKIKPPACSCLATGV